ncbi:MAG: ChbG/HpnK family deacetylase [Magnetococcales bacterium]|nr:ChbG/HpnK family deacetylase [Magnetococcales bacterium]
MTPFGPLAITADNYGLTDGINQGIAGLARTRAITGVSIMCHPAARLDHVADLKHSGVLTGVHLVMVEERPILADDPGLRPLLDRKGCFPDSWQRLCLMVLLKPWVLKGLRREVEAQINRFVELGLSLDFINSHQHVHLFPPVWMALRPLLESYKVPIRGTAQWDWQGWSFQGLLHAASWLSWHWGPRMKNSLSLKPIGLNVSGRFSMAATQELLADVHGFSRWEVPEFVVHPGVEDRQARDHYIHWGYRWDQERTTLASEDFQTFLEQSGCDLLGASMKIRERVAEATTFSTRLKAAEVVLAVAWPQNWEQMVLFSKLSDGLARKGVGPRIILPDLLFGLERHQFEHYRGFSWGRRWIDLLFWLRTLDQRIDNPEALLHWVLPSPAWAWLAGLTGIPGERIILHYSGRSYGWNKANLMAWMADPWLVGPTMISNLSVLSRFAKRLKVSHLTMDAHSAQLLTQIGCARVSTCPGLVALPGHGQDKSMGKPSEFPDPLSITVGFYGLGSPAEGVVDLLRAVALALPENPRLRLLLAVGARQRLGKIQRMVMGLHLDDRVEMVGVEDEERLLARVDAMALPYRSEVVAPLYPRMLLATSAAGCPVITTAIPAWEHLFNLTSSRLEVISPGDVPALKRVLVTLGSRVSRPFEGGAALKLSVGHPGMEAVSALHHRMSGGRFVSGQC